MIYSPTPTQLVCTLKISEFKVQLTLYNHAHNQLTDNYHEFVTCTHACRRLSRMRDIHVYITDDCHTCVTYVYISGDCHTCVTYSDHPYNEFWYLETQISTWFHTWLSRARRLQRPWQDYSTLTGLLTVCQILKWRLKAKISTYNESERITAIIVAIMLA